MKCRVCGEPTNLLFALGQMPLANNLCLSAEQSLEVERYPLNLMFCHACSLGQLRELAPPAEMFTNYAYYTSVNTPMVQAAEELSRDVAKRYLNSIKPDQLIVEIGSNDGYLLSWYKAMNWPVLGIDPAHGPALVARKRGISVIEEFFTHALAKTLPKASAIHAHNVLAHVPDLNDFLAGVKEMLAPKGVFIVEVPDAALMIKNGLFDLIYHEHVYYFTMGALAKLFNRAGLAIETCWHIPSHGGSLRIFARHGTPVAVGNIRMDTGGFTKKCETVGAGLVSTLRHLKASGKRVWGFGAAAKATVILNYAGIDDTLLDGIADSTPAKIGRYIPGTGIEVFHPNEWLASQPDYTLNFAWNYADAIHEKYATLYTGKFFTPYALPKVEVIA